MVQGSTHLLIGVAGVVAYASATGTSPDAGVYLAAAFGALLPDLDSPRSMLGRYYWWVPRVGVLAHRHFLHSIWFLLLLGGALWQAYGLQPWVLGILWGVLSHLVADYPTDGGVPLLYPLTRRRFGLRLIRSGSLPEKLLMTILAAWTLAAFVAAQHGECLLPAHLCRSV